MYERTGSVQPRKVFRSVGSAPLGPAHLVSVSRATTPQQPRVLVKIASVLVGCYLAEELKPSTPFPPRECKAYNNHELVDLIFMVAYGEIKDLSITCR